MMNPTTIYLYIHERNTHVGDLCRKVGESMTEKGQIVAGILGIVLPGTGVHRFYLGYIGVGIAQILANLLCFTGVVWGFIEGVLILSGSGITTDANGIPLRND